MNKIHGGGGVATFQISGGNVSSNTFAMGLKIKQQH